MHQCVAVKEHLGTEKAPLLIVSDVIMETPHFKVLGPISVNKKYQVIEKYVVIPFALAIRTGVTSLFRFVQGLCG